MPGCRNIGDVLANRAVPILNRDSQFAKGLEFFAIPFTPNSRWMIELVSGKLFLAGSTTRNKPVPLLGFAQDYPGGANDFMTFGTHPAGDLSGGRLTVFVDYVKTGAPGTNSFQAQIFSRGQYATSGWVLQLTYGPDFITWTVTDGTGVNQMFGPGAVIGSRYRIAVAQEQADAEMYVDGVVVLSSGSRKIPTLSGDDLQINRYGASADLNNFRLGQAVIWKRRLSSAEIAQYSGPGLYDLIWRRPRALYKAGGAVTYSATVASAIGGAASAASGTNTPPTFSAAAASAAGGAASASAATNTPPTFSASVASAAGGTASAATGTTAVPTFSANAASASGGAASAASGTTTVPTFSASIASASGGAASAASSTNTPPTFSATATSGVGGAASAATGTTADPTFSATVTSASGGAASAASGTTTQPTFSAAVVSACGGTASASAATNTPPTFSASVASAVGGVATASLATSAVPTFSAHAASAVGGTASAASGATTAPTFSASAASRAGGVASAVAATSQAPTFSASAASSVGGVASASAGLTYASLNIGTVTCAMGGVSSAALAVATPPSFTGTVTASMGGAAVIAAAQNGVFISNVACEAGGAHASATATFTPLTVGHEHKVLLPAASRPTVNPTQQLDAFVVEWDLIWPEGVEPEPEEILQTVERSSFPVGPWHPVGRGIPGTETRFVDITVDQGHFHKQWYYRVICQRVRAAGARSFPRTLTPTTEDAAKRDAEKAFLRAGVTNIQRHDGHAPMLPIATRPVVNPTQDLGAFAIEWDLSWSEGVVPDPGEISQTVERSQFPVGPWERVGHGIPGTETRFVDIAVDRGHFHKDWYYRIICQRVKR